MVENKMKCKYCKGEVVKVIHRGVEKLCDKESIGQVFVPGGKALYEYHPHHCPYPEEEK